MRSLLDINVLIALLDASHAFHRTAHDWWATHQEMGWASCPLVENGVVRIMSNPGYSRTRRLSVEELTGMLGQFMANTDHQFWSDDVSLVNRRIFSAEKIHGSKQITDLYLLGLAAKHQGRLATFDASIPASAVKSAGAKNLLVLAA